MGCFAIKATGWFLDVADLGVYMMGYACSDVCAWDYNCLMWPN